MHKPETNLGTTLFFAALGIAAYLTFGLYLNHERTLALTHIKAEPYPFPPLSDIVQNLKLLLRGFEGGYARTLHGYFIFSLMAVSFVMSGRKILNLILGQISFHWLQKLSLSYILGSLAASLLWMTLGVSGILEPWAAFLILILGFGYSIMGIFDLHKKRPIILQGLTSWRKNLSLFEKGSLIFLAAVLFLYSTNPVFYTRSSDALITHLTLPNWYINEGRLTVHPYHFHSYFPQNTEMLVTWTLLAGSEFAAQLVIWGFLLCFVALLGGFLSDLTDRSSALLAIFIFLSAPVVGYSALYVKNDLAVSLFIVAHYFVMAEAFARRTAGEPSQKWFLLSGILAGGAVGHKLTALPIACVSFLIMVSNEVYAWMKGISRQPSSPIWALGLLLSSGPWLLRTFLETGNPVFPFLTQIFGNRVSPFYDDIENKFYFSQSGANALKNYFHHVLNLGKNTPDSWGPTFSFALLVPFIFINKFSSGIRLAMAAAVLSGALLLQSMDIRFHMGLLAFILTVSFALFGANAWSGKRDKLFFPVTAAVILIHFAVLWKAASRDFVLKSSFHALLSGNSPGNFIGTRAPDPGPGQMRWVSRVLNTRTPSQDAVLYAGLHYAYGLKRKLYFSSGFDREMIADFLAQSRDSAQLADHLLSLGIRHLVLPVGFQVPEADRNKLADLIQREMALRFATPDRKILWYTFKGQEDLPRIVLDRADAQEFPMMFIEEIQARIQEGNVGEAKRMTEEALHAPMSSQNRDVVRKLLLLIQSDANR